MATESLTSEEARFYARDARWITMLVGLDQLDDAELRTLASEAALPPERSQLLTDTGNYDPSTKRWCALAVAVGAPAEAAAHRLELPTAAYGRGMFVEHARLKHPDFSTNALSGVRGEVFTSDRLVDLRVAVGGLIAIRHEEQMARPFDWSAGLAEEVFVAGTRELARSGSYQRA